jgi:phenylacetic acid degradation protein paaN
VTTTIEPVATGSAFFALHRELLSSAVDAIGARTYWSAFNEHPKAYGEDADTAGRKSFEALLGKPFPLAQPGSGSFGGEHSPYGFELGITYPLADADSLLASMESAIPAWRDAGPDVRAGVCLEILARLNARSHELAYAVMHTTGQGFMMAFQAGGPHAQDRGLEAIAYSYSEMIRHASEARWEKSQGRRPPLRMLKQFHVVPRGIALVVGCSTFPTWNAYPGIFASLVTGNPVLVKPSRRAVLPLALTVAIARDVLLEAGFDPSLVSLAVGVDAKEIATRPEVAIIDYTGSSEFGDWLEANAPQARVFAEKAGVNAVVIDSTTNYRGMLANLAFTLSLYSGQMCTTTQNVFLPRGGIETDEGGKSFDDVTRDLAGAIESLLHEPATASAILGAIANDEVLERVEQASATLGRVVLHSRAVEHPEFSNARMRTPVLIALDVVDDAVYGREHFGPIAFLIATDSTAQSLERLQATVVRGGGLTAGIYSNDETALVRAMEVALGARVALSVNLTGDVYVNQSAAFSDFHATGGNPAANATLTDGAFVSSRFVLVQSRRHLREDE